MTPEPQVLKLPLLMHSWRVLIAVVASSMATSDRFIILLCSPVLCSPSICTKAYSLVLLLLLLLTFFVLHRLVFSVHFLILRFTDTPLLSFSSPFLDAAFCLLIYGVTFDYDEWIALNRNTPSTHTGVWRAFSRSKCRASLVMIFLQRHALKRFHSLLCTTLSLEHESPESPSDVEALVTGTGSSNASTVRLVSRGSERNVPSAA